MRRSFDVNCKACGKQFKAIKSQLENKRGIYCSKKCTYDGFFLDRVAAVDNLLDSPIKNWLVDKYVDKLWSYRDIHKVTGMNSRMIKKVLTHFGIEIRYGSEAVATQWIKNPARKYAGFPASSGPRCGYGNNGVIPKPEIICATWLDVLCVKYTQQWVFEKPNRKDGVDYQADFMLDELNTIIEVQTTMSKINPDRHLLLTNQIGMRVFYIPSRFFVEKVTREKFLKFLDFVRCIEMTRLDPSTVDGMDFMSWSNPYCLMQKLNPD